MNIGGIKLNATVVIIIVIVLLLLIGLGIYFYRQGKKNALPPKVKFEEGTNALPSGWRPEPLADELHQVMDESFTLTGTKDKAWQKLIDLPTNDMVRAVYNAYNDLYFEEGYGTLTEWIKDEGYYDYTSGVKDKAIERLRKLNLI